MIKIFSYNIFIFSMLSFLNVQAQEEVYHVVSKKIEKTFEYQEGYELNVEGEKADLTIESWDKNEIFIRIELISKHPDIDKAKDDLTALTYVAKRLKNKIYLRNFVKKSDEKKALESILKVKYFIKLPESCPVYLKTYFGETSLANLSNSLRLNARYTTIGMTNLSGIINTTAKFSDITAERISGNVSIHSRRSDISLKEISGHFDIQAQYGKVSVFSIDPQLDLNITAEDSDVFFYTPDPGKFGYELSTYQGEIDLPENISTIKKNTEELLQKVEAGPNSTFYYPNVTIQVVRGNISVGGVKHF